jgi:hypothetical protein
MSELVVTRAGPRHATLVRARTVRGRTVTLVLVVEVWGAGDRRIDLEQRLVGGLAHTFETAPGSFTARVRAALTRGHAWLAAQAPAGPVPLGAGASLLVLADDEVLLAQVGPALAFGPPASTGAADGPPGPPTPPVAERYPAAGPWLKRGLTHLAPDPAWPPLGLGAAPGVHWASWRARPGDRFLLAATACAEALSRETVAQLVTVADSRAADALAAAVPADAPAVLVIRPAPGPAAVVPPPAGARPPTADKSPAGSPPGVTPGSGAGAPPPPTAAAPAIPAPPPRWQVLAARLARGGARVLTAVLPTRPASGSESYRVERARLLAALALALPILVLVVAIAHGLRTGTLATTSTAAPVDQAPLAGPTARANDDPAARIVRLAGAVPLVTLPGQADDDRAVVVAGGVPYVLNRTRNQVDRFAGTALETVLRRGQALGDTPVGNLEDLFGVPGGAAGDRVMALDAAGNLWRVDGPTATAVPRSETPTWQAVTRATGWQGQLYVADRAAGQVWRYAPAGAGFPTAGVAWLVDPVPLPTVIDLAIDGDVYLLERDGAVRRYNAGSPLPFQLAAVPEGFPQGRSLYASQSQRGLLLTDPVNGRLLAFARDGSFQAQLLFPPLASGDETTHAGRLRDLQDAWWDEANALLYVVAGTWLYRAPYAGIQ